MMLANGGSQVRSVERTQMIDAVLAAPLPDTHPLKVAALLNRADLSAQSGDTAAAQAAFTRTGLSSDQCALIAPTPPSPSKVPPAPAIRPKRCRWASKAGRGSNSTSPPTAIR